MHDDVRPGVSQSALQFGCEALLDLLEELGNCFAITYVYFADRR